MIMEIAMLISGMVVVISLNKNKQRMPIEAEKLHWQNRVN